MWVMTVVRRGRMDEECFAQSWALRSAEGATRGPSIDAGALPSQRALIFRLLGHFY